MNWLKRKFWMWWFFKCPVGYSFMGHENGKLFWFYPFGMNVRYKKGEYISIYLKSGLTPRAPDLGQAVANPSNDDVAPSG